jgi:hypothetical protein
MRFTRTALAMAAALTLCAAIGVPAAGAAERQAPPAPAATYDTGDRDGPVARAACPFCVVGAIAVVRAAVAIRAASTARTIVAAAATARAAASRVMQRVPRPTVRRVQQRARTISARGREWVKRNWNRFKPELQACLLTTAFMKSKGFLEDRILTEQEWRAYVIFGPRLVPPLETMSMVFPIEFDASEFAKEAADEAIACAIGIGAGHYFANRNT